MLGQGVFSASLQSKIARVADALDSCAAIQRHGQAGKLSLEESHGVEMHLGRNKPTHHYTLGTNHLGTSFAENDLRILMDNEMNRSQPCVLTAKTANSSLH